MKAVMHLYRQSYKLSTRTIMFDFKVLKKYCNCIKITHIYVDIRVNWYEY